MNCTNCWSGAPVAALSRMSRTALQVLERRDLLLRPVCSQKRKGCTTHSALGTWTGLLGEFSFAPLAVSGMEREVVGAGPGIFCLLGSGVPAQQGAQKGAGLSWLPRSFSTV